MLVVPLLSCYLSTYTVSEKQLSSLRPLAFLVSHLLVPPRSPTLLPVNQEQTCRR